MVLSEKARCECSEELPLAEALATCLDDMLSSLRWGDLDSVWLLVSKSLTMTQSELWADQRLPRRGERLGKRMVWVLVLRDSGLD